jgi:hypothetical protein
VTVTSQQGNLILKLLNTSDTGVWFKGDLIGVQLVFESSIDHVNTAPADNEKKKKKKKKCRDTTNAYSICIA